MPKPWEEMVEEFPGLSEKERYRTLIKKVTRQRVPRAIVLTLEFLDEPQAGRELVQKLPLPLRPAGITASCFKAAGMSIQAGKKVNPKHLEGHSVAIRVARKTAAEWTIVSFESISKEDRNEPGTGSQSAAVHPE